MNWLLSHDAHWAFLSRFCLLLFFRCLIFASPLLFLFSKNRGDSKNFPKKLKIQQKLRSLCVAGWQRWQDIGGWINHEPIDPLRKRRMFLLSANSRNASVLKYHRWINKDTSCLNYLSAFSWSLKATNKLPVKKEMRGGCICLPLVLKMLHHLLSGCCHWAFVPVWLEVAMTTMKQRLDQCLDYCRPFPSFVHVPAKKQRLMCYCLLMPDFASHSSNVTNLVVVFSTQRSVAELKPRAESAHWTKNASNRAFGK